MRISDWSSDVCSSDLLMGHALKQLTCDQVTGRWKVAAETLSDETITINAAHVISSAPMRELAGRIHPLPVTLGHAMDLKYRDFLTVEIGRASYRERVCQYV